MHCLKVEPWAQLLKKSSTGLSATSLRRCIQFFSATPIMSPPTLCLATPTDVQSTTVRYLEDFLEDWAIDQVPPASWINHQNDLQPSMDELFRIENEDLLFFDGDTGHLTLSMRSCEIFESMVTHRIGGDRTVRFRTRGNDAPELETAFKLFRVAHDGLSATSWTEHSGVDSLRCARKAVANAARIYFHLPRDASGRLLILEDLYGRFLLDIWVQPDENNRELFLLPEILARSGHTIPLYANGIDVRIYRAMLEAKEARRGIFKLPAEIRKKPFRPWDIRKSEPSTTQDHAVVDSPDNIHHIRYQLSSLWHEGLVYPGKSTLPAAGLGLFLRPSGDVIKKGDYLCTYATSWTPTRPCAQAGNYS